MKYAILLLILLMFAAGASAMEIKEVKKPQVCKNDKITVECAYFLALILQDMKRCKECDWKTKKI